MLDARPGAVLYLGLADDATVTDLEASARFGASTAHLMRQLQSRPGRPLA